MKNKYRSIYKNELPYVKLAAVEKAAHGIELDPVYMEVWYTGVCPDSSSFTIKGKGFYEILWTAADSAVRNSRLPRRVTEIVFTYLKRVCAR